VARFLCRLLRLTFSLLPTQLAPYCQYTLAAIIGALLLGLASRQQGEQGFQGAVLAVDPDSLVTPWLVACWLVLVRSGLQRAHAVLRRWYDLSGIRTAQCPGAAWEEVAAYFRSLDWNPEIRWGPGLRDLLNRFSRTTKRFLWGIPAQQRTPKRRGAS
jgi:hypothetical protein